MGIRGDTLFSYTSIRALAVAPYMGEVLNSTNTHRLTRTYEGLDGRSASQRLALVGASPLHKEETGTHNPGNLRIPDTLTCLPVEGAYSRPFPVEGSDP